MFVAETFRIPPFTLSYGQQVTGQAYSWFMMVRCIRFQITVNIGSGLLQLFLGFPLSKNSGFYGVKVYGKQDDQAFDDELIVELEFQHVHAVIDDAEDQGTNDRAGDRSIPAAETDAAENRGSDGFALIADTYGGLAAVHAGCEDDTGD